MKVWLNWLRMFDPLLPDRRRRPLTSLRLRYLGRLTAFRFVAGQPIFPKTSLSNAVYRTRAVQILSCTAKC